MMKQQIIYVTDCSDHATSLDGEMFCRLTKDQIKPREIMCANGAKAKNYTCAEHGGFVVHRIISCVDCGVEVVVGIRGQAPCRCKKHRAERKALIAERQEMRRRERMRKSYEARALREKLLLEEALREQEERAFELLKEETSRLRYDCKNRDKCLMAYFNRPEAEYIEECYQCQQYQPEPIRTFVFPENTDHYLPSVEGLGDLYHRYIWKKSA